MSEITTCEQYVLAELQRVMAENDMLRSNIKELENAMADSPNGEIEPRQVQMFKLNEPFETVYLTVRGYYDFISKNHGLGLTADEAREKASTRDGLMEVAEIYVGWGGPYPVMSVETRLWPFQLRTGNQTFVVDLCNNCEDILESRVCKDEEEVRADRYYPSYRADELFEFGLEQLKKNLLEYADKLDAKAEKESENE